MRAAGITGSSSTAKHEPGAGICAVCANRPTVRSHVIPRALFHDSKRPGRTMILGGTEPGYKVTQSGKWSSRVLCAVHEDKLGACDDYGVAFCRAWQHGEHGAGSLVVPNPSPALLVDFALACIWRMAAAVSGGSPIRVMGPNGDFVEGRLFGPGEGCDPALFVQPIAFDDGGGRPLVLGLLPMPADRQRRSWQYIVSGLRFLIDFSQTADAPGAVNQLSEVTMSTADLRSVDEVEGLPASFARMAAPRRPSRRL